MEISPKTTKQAAPVSPSPLELKSDELGLAVVLQQTLERARREYSAGRLDAVLQLLAPMLDQPVPSTSGGAGPDSPLRLVASMLALLARAADRHGERDLGATAAARAASLRDQLVSSGATLATEEVCDFGIALYLAGRVAEGAAMLAEPVARRAATAEATLFKGLAEASLGRHEQAVEALKLAAAVEGHDLQQKRLERLASSLQAVGRAAEAAVVYYELANLHYAAAPAAAGPAAASAHYTESLAALNRTIELDPGHNDALAKKGEVLRLLGSLEEARGVLEQVLERAPRNAWAYAVYGETLRALDRLDDAAGAFSRALELDSSVAQWHRSYGEVLHLQKRFPEALASFERSLERNPEDATAIARRGEVLRVLGRRDEALVELARALEKLPDDTWILASQGEALRNVGRLAEAEEALQRALKLTSGGYPFAQVALGQVWLDRGREADAAAAFEAVLKEDSTYAWALEGLTHALLRLDRIERGLQACDQLLSLQPESAWAHAVRGTLLFQVEKYGEAREALARSLKIEPRVEWAQNAYAVCCIWLARLERRDVDALLDEAIAASRTALEITPTDVSWRETLAEALKERPATRDEGLEEYKRILDELPDKLDYFAALAGGWAAFQLASASPQDSAALLDRAERLTIEALTQRTDKPTSTDAIIAKFNLAFVMLCGRRFALALREFDTALSFAVEHHETGVRRGVLGRAVVRMAGVIADWPMLEEIAHVRKAAQRLDAAYAGEEFTFSSRQQAAGSA